MANFHETLVLNKYMLSLFGIDSIGRRILGKGGVEIFKDLKYSNNEGYTEEGNTRYLQALINHLYQSPFLTPDRLQQYDENIVRFTRQISDKREEQISWKYFQYLSLLFTEIYLDKYFSNKVELLAELNEFVRLFNQKQIERMAGLSRGERAEVFVSQKFTIDRLNKLAFWNATGSGKTLLMHIHIKQYLYYAKKHQQGHKNKVLLITPNEGLSKQHLEQFELSDIQAAIFNKSSSGMFSGKEVEILEITKLAEDSGDKTVAVDQFETENLVLIDEGHGGMGGDAWKRYRDKLSETGFAFEYSATFGQAISATTKTKRVEFTQEYAKSILFDYSYKYFYQDGYGKDYRILNLKEDDKNYRRHYLIANLVSFYQQQLIFKEKGFLLRNFLLEKPLWIFVGGKVNAVRTEQGKQVSDVLTIIYFLTDFLKNPIQSIQAIEDVVQNKAGLVDKNGYSIFETSFSYLIQQRLSGEDIFRGINELVFHNTVIGANLYLDQLKGADGELGLRVGDNDYFGVINVGDEGKLFNLAMDNAVLGVERDFSTSLFKGINEKDSSINLLIGSKKFTEGWSSWRVSSMGLMNVGKKEGAQVIQLFGRGVRLKGYQFSLKRSTGLDDFQKPNNIREIRPYLRPLETLQIFGVQANYMEQFKEFLEEEGLPTNDSSWITIKIQTKQKKIVSENRLKLIQVRDDLGFKKKKLITLELELPKFDNKRVIVDRYPRIDVLQQNQKGFEITKNEAQLTEKHLAFLDWNALYLAIQEYKADKGFSNLSVSKVVLKEILKSSSWYRLLVPAYNMNFKSFENTFIWQELAEILLKRYIEQIYLHYKNSFNADNIEVIVLKGSEDNFILEYDIRLNSEEEIEQYRQKVEQLKTEVADPAFSHIQIASEASAFDNLLHLYKPLIYVGNGLKNLIKVNPIALDASEKQFLDDLIQYVENHQSLLEDTEIHILRNQSKKGLGFFTDGNNFYPDFILWIIKEGTQSIKFIDPKGIRNSRGINDPKIQFYKVLKDKVQPQVKHSGLKLDSFIVSNTALLEVQWKGQLSEADFNKEHVYFQDSAAVDYVEEIINS